MHLPRILGLLLSGSFLSGLSVYASLEQTGVEGLPTVINATIAAPSCYKIVGDEFSLVPESETSLAAGTEMILVIDKDSVPAGLRENKISLYRGQWLLGSPRWIPERDRWELAGVAGAPIVHTSIVDRNTQAGNFNGDWPSSPDPTRPPGWEYYHGVRASKAEWQQYFKYEHDQIVSISRDPAGHEGDCLRLQNNLPDLLKNIFNADRLALIPSSWSVLPTSGDWDDLPDSRSNWKAAPHLSPKAFGGRTWLFKEYDHMDHFYARIRLKAKYDPASPAPPANVVPALDIGTDGQLWLSCKTAEGSPANQAGWRAYSFSGKLDRAAFYDWRYNSGDTINFAPNYRGSAWYLDDVDIRAISPEGAYYFTVADNGASAPDLVSDVLLLPNRVETVNERPIRTGSFWETKPPEFIEETAKKSGDYPLGTVSETVVADYKPTGKASELRDHYQLERLVRRYNKDPLALANYVYNEIKLVEPYGWNAELPTAAKPDIQADSDMLWTGGLTRSALSTYLDGRGSPIEQCALLIYLLRSCGVPAAYAWSKNERGLTLSRSYVSRLLGVNLDELPAFALTPDIAVRYPWVVAYIPDGAGQYKPVRLFPWMKDIDVIQGLNMWDHLPENIDTSEEFCGYYFNLGDSDGVAPFQPDPAFDLEKSDMPTEVVPAILERELRKGYPNFSLSDFGMKRVERKHYFRDWTDFPAPTLIGPSSSPNVDFDPWADLRPFAGFWYNTARIDISLKDAPSVRISTGELPWCDLLERRIFVQRSFPGAKRMLYLGPIDHTRDTGPAKTASTSPIHPSYVNALGMSGMSMGNIFDDENLMRKVGCSLSEDLEEGPVNVKVTLETGRFALYRQDMAQALGGKAPVNPKDAFTAPAALGGLLDVRLYLTPVYEYKLELGDNDYLCHIGIGGSTGSGAGVSNAMDEFAFYDSVKALPAVGASNYKAAWVQGMALNLVAKQYAMRMAEAAGSLYPLSNMAVPPQFFNLGLFSYEIASATKVYPVVDIDVATAWTGHRFSSDLATGDRFDYDGLSGREYDKRDTKGARDLLWLQASAAEHDTIRTVFGISDVVSTVSVLQRAAREEGNGVMKFDFHDFKDYEPLINNDSHSRYTWNRILERFAEAAHYVFFVPRHKISTSGYYDYGVAGLSPHGGMWAGISRAGTSRAKNGGSGTEVDKDADGAENQVSEQNRADNGTAGSQEGEANTASIAGGTATADHQASTDESADINGSSDRTEASTTAHGKGTVTDGGSSTNLTSSDAVGDPVDVTTGAFLLNEQDLAFTGPIPLGFGRNYSSFNIQYGPLGYGWVFTLKPYLLSKDADKTVNFDGVGTTEDDDDQFYVTLPDGNEFLFSRVANNPTEWQALPADNKDAINPNGELFAANIFAARLTKIGANYTLRLQNGYRLVYERKSFPILNAEGTTYVSRDRPYLRLIEDPAGNRLQVFYYGEEIVDPDGNGPADYQVDATTGWIQYRDRLPGDPEGQAIRRSNAYGEIMVVRASNGQHANFTYTRHGNLASIEFGDGRVVRYEYDDFGDLRAVVRADGSRVELEYALRDGVRDGVSITGTTISAAASDNSLNDSGNGFVVAGFQAGDKITISGFTGATQNNVTATIATVAAGKIVLVEEDGAEMVNDAAGESVSLATVAQPVSTHLLRRIKQPDGRVLINAYAQSDTSDYRQNDGRVDVSYPPAERNTNPVTGTPNSFHFERPNRRVLAQWATVGLDLRPVRNATFVYLDLDPQKASSIDANDTTKVYDAFNVPSGSPANDTHASPSGNRPSIYTHDKGMITQIVDTLGQTIVQDWYSATDPATGAYAKSLQRQVDKRGLETTYLYDADGNVKKHTVKGRMDGDPATVTEARETEIWYNDFNRPVLVCSRQGARAAGAPADLIIQYTYNGYPKSPSTPAVRIGEGYLADSETILVGTVSPAGAVSGTVVSHRKLEYESQTPDPNSPPDKLYQYAYAHGLLKREAVAAGSTTGASAFYTSFVNDASGLVSGVRAHATETATLGAAPSDSSADMVTTLAYNIRKELVSESMPGRYEKRHTYDPLGRPRLSQVFATPSGGGATRLAESATYYNDNGEPVWTDGPRKGAAEDYVFRDYDGAGRVIAEVVWRSEAKADGTGIQSVSDRKVPLAVMALSLSYYDAFNNLTRVVDPEGNYTLRRYDAIGQLLHEETFDGDTDVSLGGVSYDYRRTTAYEGTQAVSAYEGGGQPTRITSANGAEVSFTYTQDGKNLSRTGADGTTTTWRYYPDGRLQKQLNPNGSYQLLGYDDITRTTTTTFHDASGLLLYTDSVTKDFRGNVVSTTHVENGQSPVTATSEYDAFGRVKNSEGAAGAAATSTAGGSARQRVEYRYATDGSWIFAATPTIFDSSGTITAYEISVSRFDALGRTVSTATYFHNGGTLPTAPPTGTTNLLTQVAYTYDADFHYVEELRGEAGSGQRTRSRVYTDIAGRPVLKYSYDSGEESAPMSAFARTVYDRNGNAVQSRDELSRITTVDYDGLGRPVVSTLPDGAVTRLSYDLGGNLTSRLMPGGLQWSAGYDSAGRKAWEQLAGAKGDITRRFRFSYHAGTGSRAGLPLRVVDELRGITTVFGDYDARGRLRAEVTTVDAARSPHVAGYRRSYTYAGPLGQLTRLDLSYPGGEHPATSVEYTLDAYGQTLRELTTFAGATHASWKQSWDGAGRRTALQLQGTAAASYSYGFGYNGDKRSGTYGLGGVTRTLTYGRMGALESETGGVFSSTQTYDGRGRLAGQNWSFAPTGTGAGGALFTQGLTYNLDNKLKKNTRTGHAFGAVSRTDSYTYDPDLRGQLTQEVQEAIGTRSYSYGFDSAKLGVRTRFGGSLVFDHAALNGEVDSFGRVRTEGVPAASSIPVNGTISGASGVELEVATPRAGAPGEWDSVSTVQAKVTTPAGTPPVANWSVDLDFAAGSYRVEAYAHDPRLGRLPQPMATTQFTVAGLAYAAGQVISHDYDAAGFLIRRRFAAGRTQTFTWDALGRLLRMRDLNAVGTGTQWSASYDALGRRIRTDQAAMVAGLVTSPTGTTTSWFDPSAGYLELGVFRSAVGITPERVWKLYGADLNGGYGGLHGIGGLIAVARESADGATLGDWTWLADDALGNLVGTAQLSGDSWAYTQSTVEVTAYGPANPDTAAAQSWATDTAAGASLAKASFWRGYRIDPTGFYWMGARYYDPKGGRFISPDPLGHAECMDLYSFANGDPVNRVDPSGMEAQQQQPSENTTNPTSAGGEGNRDWNAWQRFFLAETKQEWKDFNNNFTLWQKNAAAASYYGISYAAYAKHSVMGYILNPLPGNHGSRILSLDIYYLLEEPMPDDFDLYFEFQVGVMATDIFPWGTMSTSELQEAYARGYISRWDLPAATDMAAGAQGHVGWSLGEALQFVATELFLTVAGEVAAPLVLGRVALAPERAPSAFARSLQGSGNYPGVDRFKDIVLKKDTIIFGGAPGQSNFYTTASAVRRSGGNADTLFQGLQVGPHPVHGYRPGVTAYRVLEDSPAAFGRTLANPQHGAGRYPQIVLEGFETKLEPLYSIPLRQP